MLDCQRLKTRWLLEVERLYLGAVDSLGYSSASRALNCCGHYVFT